MAKRHYQSGAGASSPNSIEHASKTLMRAGRLMLNSGAGSWRVHQVMCRLGEVLGLKVDADVGLNSIDATVTDGEHTVTEVVNVAIPGTSTSLIDQMDHLLEDAEELGPKLDAKGLDAMVSAVERDTPVWGPWQTILACALACGSFAFLLGGGPIEFLCAFFGGGLGMAVNVYLGSRGYNPMVAICIAVAVSCGGYLAVMYAAAAMMPNSDPKQAGYIAAILYSLPGFPLIASGLDLFRLEMRGGFERLLYAMVGFLLAAAIAWLVADLFGLYPEDLEGLGLPFIGQFFVELTAGFVAAIMLAVLFGGRPSFCLISGVIGAIICGVKYLLVSGCGMEVEAATFIAATCIAILAAISSRLFGCSKLAVSVPPSILLIPGLFLYRAVYFMATTQIAEGIEWFVQACIIILFIPLGIVFGRVLTDGAWRKM